MRGYCGIGIYHPKHEVNVGTLWRSAYALGAAFIFTVGARYRHQSSDTTKTWRQLPYFAYLDVPEFNAHRPYDCPLVGIEMTPDARPLETFTHPERALYLLGAEDSGLSSEALALCQYVVRITGWPCLNVASAGTVVLYDRQLKARWSTYQSNQLGLCVEAKLCNVEPRTE